MLGIFLILLAATTSHGATGGAGVLGPAGQDVPAAGAPSAAELGERVLQEGSTGPDVRTLQAILEARHYGDLKLTGIFDSATDHGREALPDRRPGSQPDGVVGPQTRPGLLALDALPARHLVRPRPVRQPHRLRQAPAAGDARRRPQVAALRHARDVLPRRALHHRAR